MTDDRSAPPARPRLGLRRPATEDGEPAPPIDVVRQAIGRGTCVRAVYNRTVVKLAPHILYTRHDEPFVDGVVVERNGAPPREAKLGTFKLTGLSQVSPTTTPLTRFNAFDPAAERYLGTTLCAIDGGAAETA